MYTCFCRALRCRGLSFAGRRLESAPASVLPDATPSVGPAVLATLIGSDKSLHTEVVTQQEAL